MTSNTHDESTRFLSFIYQKANDAIPSAGIRTAVWDENYRILPPIDITLYSSQSSHPSYHDLIRVYQWDSIMELKSTWDNLKIAYGCQDDHFTPTALNLFRFSDTLTPTSPLKAESLEAGEERIRLLASANFNPLLRLPEIREYIIREIDSAATDGFQDFLRELLLSLCTTTLSHEEKFNYSQFLKRATAHARRIIVKRSVFQVDPREREFIRKCAEHGSTVLSDHIMGICAVIYGFLCDADRLLRTDAAWPQPYMFREEYRSNGRVTLGPLTPVPDKQGDHIDFTVKSDCYNNYFENYEDAGRSRYWASQTVSDMESITSKRRKKK